MVFVEAKSSSPRQQNAEKFEEYVEDIADKFVHSLTFYNAVRLRHSEEELPHNIGKVDLHRAHYSFVLVIHGHPISWLPPLMDALKNKMRNALRLWHINDSDVKVINDETALASHLIVGSEGVTK